MYDSVQCDHMNTKTVLSQGFASRSVLMLTSIALSSIALGLTLYKAGPMAKIFAAMPTDKCIVTISGVQYDLTALGTMHSGPQGTTLTGPAGFFQCGTDMTAVYQGQHGNNVSRLAPYVYTPPVTTTPTPTPIITGTTSPAPTPSVSPTLGATPTATPSPKPTIHVEDYDDINELEVTREEKHKTDEETHALHDSKEEKHSDDDDSIKNESRHSTGRSESHSESRKHK